MSMNCRAGACLFSAMEHCHDSIEIATLDTERGECLLQVRRRTLVSH